MFLEIDAKNGNAVSFGIFILTFKINLILLSVEIETKTIPLMEGSFFTTSLSTLFPAFFVRCCSHWNEMFHLVLMYTSLIIVMMKTFLNVTSQMYIVSRQESTYLFFPFLDGVIVFYCCVFEDFLYLGY